MSWKWGLLPKCKWCGKGARNPLKCKKCSGWFTPVLLCCEKCAIHHFNARHAEVSASPTAPPASAATRELTRALNLKREAEERLADELRLERERKERSDTLRARELDLKQQQVIAEQERLQKVDDLLKRLTEAKKELTTVSEEWERAGRPNLSDEELAFAKNQADDASNSLKRLRRSSTKLWIRIRLFRALILFRLFVVRFELPWHVAAAFGGCFGFAAATLLALLLVRNVGLASSSEESAFFVGSLRLVSLSTPKPSTSCDGKCQRRLKLNQIKTDKWNW
jgi:hypothetical protein